MKNLCTFITGVLLLICCGWSHSIYGSYAETPQTKIDGVSAIANVWRVFDWTNFQYKIRADYDSNSFLDLTDSSQSYAFPPLLATSTSVLATTRAVAVWQAWDNTTLNYVIQVAVVNTPLLVADWDSNSVTTLSLNDGTEMPSTDYQVDISDDGQIINATWSADMSSGDRVIRFSTSTDGGATWSAPATRP